MKKRSSPFLRIRLKPFVVAIAVLAAVFAAGWIGYRLGLHDVREELAQERERSKLLLEQLREIATAEENITATARMKTLRQEDEIGRLRGELRELLERERSRGAVMPQHEYAPKDTKAAPPVYKRKERHEAGVPKLVIIIDDVSYARDVKMIRSTNLPLVMSFLPPSPRHPKSAELARGEQGYMVHLPLEAVDFNDEESETLRVGSSEAQIAKRISELRGLYPEVRFMNNHTGSKFTADRASMERLIRLLKKEGIGFVDSRTTPETKAPDIAEQYGLPYRGRDVFLDHKNGVENVKKQIKEAVAKAKKHGTAIAIGHPRPDTIQALIESKQLLEEVELVGIDQI